MKILFADKFQESYLKDIEALGHECVLEPGLSADDLPERIAGFEALVVRSTKVTAATIEASDRLSLILRAGAGTNTIDKAAAAARGIYVCNIPGKNAIAVAELAFGLLLAIDRNIPDNVIELRSGKWNKKRWSAAEGLYGRTVGVVGLGEIGLAFAERAAAFGMTVLGVRRAQRSTATEQRIERIGIELVGDLYELVRRADAVSFHVPATADTKGMINRELLSHLRPGTILINTSRGDVVDDAALLEAIEAKKLRVGLDVYNGEPSGGTGEIDSPLAAHPSVYGTHHIGASTEQAQNAIAAEAVKLIAAFDNGEVRYCVNMIDTPIGSAVLTIRHYDRVGVLSSVFDILRKADINVEQMNNQIFDGAKAACATLHVNGEVTDAVTHGVAAIPEVINLSVKRRG